MDLGQTTNVQDFWFGWEEDGNKIVSEREVFPVFDQTPLNLKLESCLEFDWNTVNVPKKTVLLAGNRWSFRIGDVTGTDKDLVLADGVASRTHLALTLDPLPIGKYEMKLFFHDAAAKPKLVSSSFRRHTGRS